ncbi:MAG: signal peptidase I [Muricomes sp.]
MKRKRSKTRRNTHVVATICSAAGSFFLILVVLLCIPLTVPRLLGYEVYTVVSGSMEPAIPTGSLVFVHNQSPEKIEKDDVIAFYSETSNGAIITHRVVQNNTVSGEFITKGDANAAEDMNPIGYDYLIGKVVWSMPVFGRILAAIVTTSGKLTAAGLIIVAVILHVVAGRLRAE